MTTSLLAAAVFCAFAMLLVFAGAASAADPFTPQGQATIKVLDAMGVESKWLGGEQNGSPGKAPPAAGSSSPMPPKRRLPPTAGCSWSQVTTIITTIGPAMEQIAAEGPDVIQAGSVNRRSVTLREGFAGHPAA